jgi:serine/threonine-protein phosphatase 2A regulatory subunit B'
VEEILEMISYPLTQNIECTHDLFRRIALCIASPHFQVAERALFLWNNEYIVTLISYDRQEILPILMGALEAVKGHWNLTVKGLGENVIKLMKEINQADYEAAEALHKSKQADALRREGQLTARWEEVEKLGEQMQSISLQG